MNHGNAVPVSHRSRGGGVRRLVSLLAAFAVVFSGLALAGPASADHLGTGLKGVTLDWTGNLTQQFSLGGPQYVYFSAGESIGDEATYSTQTGNVSVVHRTPEGVETTPTWATKNAYLAGGVNRQLVRLSNGEALIQDDGSAVVTWDGAWSVNFYTGLIPFTVHQPRLIVDADGSAELRADLTGYTQTKEPLTPVPNAVVASFASGVEIDPDGAITITPDYAGVEVETPGGTPQNRVVEGWGSWPQSWVNLMLQSGLHSHWYSSGSATADPRKPPYPIKVDFTNAEPASIITVGTPSSVKYGRTKLAIKPLVSNSSGRPVAIATGDDGVCSAVNGGKYIKFDSPGDCELIATSTAGGGHPAGEKTVHIQVTKATANVQRFKIAPKKAKPGIARTLRVIVKRVSPRAAGDLAGTVTITDENDEVVATIVVPGGSTKRKVKVETSFDTAGIAPLTTVKLKATYSGNGTYEANYTKNAQFRVKKA